MGPIFIWYYVGSMLVLGWYYVEPSGEGDDGDDGGRILQEHPSPILHAIRDNISRKGKFFTVIFSPLPRPPLRVLQYMFWPTRNNLSLACHVHKSITKYLHPRISSGKARSKGTQAGGSFRVEL